ncbi:MAG: peptide-methionine (S)-S-oxide reductase MsrA [Synergistaceae bacterium]|jgi:peptide methionine sulfoxide reductase msrA/msrB|nr:peptide-methionine (S)-S-oxide reductase MsrA [Synergistaceae bacterium]
MLPSNPNKGKEFNAAALRTIYLAGGCFWGVEAFMARVPGVAKTVVGYANGSTENPTYDDVKYRGTGHAETVEVRYDPQQVSLEALLERFFSVIDPLSVNKQGEDEGVQYRTGVYYTNGEDRAVAEKVFAAEEGKRGGPLAVELLPLVRFDRAEEYHQEYLEKNPNGYCHIHFGA